MTDRNLELLRIMKGKLRTISDNQIENLRKDLMDEKQELESRLSDLRVLIEDCDIALSHRYQGKHPNDPDYPTEIEEARKRCLDFFHTKYQLER